ncbi:MAG: hypothetical protein ACRC1W_17190 [Shewanella sp.]
MEAITGKKTGPKPSLVKRELKSFRISNYQSDKLDELELLLKTEGLTCKRGRSETVELAINLAITLIKDHKNGIKGGKVWSIGVLKDIEGREDRQALEDNSDN